jgi:hypothetical protein
MIAASCSATLAGCGGSQGEIKMTAASVPAWRDPITPDGIKEHRNVAHVGGTPGWVCANRWTTTYVAPEVTSFEWNLVAILANEAKAGENCAFYAQANARNTGNTWAAVSEICDETYGSKQQTLVAHEFDVWCAGPDKLDRVGVHVVVGDSRAVRRVGTPGIAIATDAIRISSNHAGARWRNGIHFDATPDYLMAMKEEAIVREPLGQYIGKLPIKVGGRTVFIPVYE